MTDIPSDRETETGGSPVRARTRPEAGIETSPMAHCWRVERAERVAVLVDGENYFAVARQAMLSARRRILILGWDLHTQTDLAPDGVEDDLPTRLDPFLHALLKSRPDLEIYLLCWDFAMIYALEREWAPVLTPTWLTHDRLHFEMDGRHPVGASQHQKLLVVDDTLAFCGGFDLSKWRWDSRRHRARDDLRLDPDGKPYPPFHDVQLLVDGAAARTLDELARWRWERATGQVLSALDDEPGSRANWPQDLRPDFTGTDVGIARTLPQYQDQPEVREIECLLHGLIAAARRSIYIENQYLTSDSITRALCERLVAEQGPELVIVLPRQTGAWLEKKTMDVLRSRVLKRLRAADRHDRLRVYYPEIPGLEGDCLSVHSKLMIVDDRFLCVGSANLSNRSMGLDSECNLLIEASDEATATAIARVRDDLMAEHLGCSYSALARVSRRHSSLIAIVDALNRRKRGLRKLHGELSEELERQLPDSRYIDPEQTVQPDQILEQLWQRPSRAPVRRRLLSAALVIGTLLGLAVLWRWTPLADYLQPETLRGLMMDLQPSLLNGALMVLIFVLASLVSFPLTLLVVALAMAFPPGWAFLYSITGAMLAAGLTFLLGAWLGRDAVRRWAGRRINRISRKVARRGILAVVFLRIVPLAPFTVINLVAGASHVRTRDFLLGSLLGLTPGIGALTLFVDGVVTAVNGSGPLNLGVLAVGAIILLLLALLRVLWLRRQKNLPGTDA